MKRYGPASRWLRDFISDVLTSGGVGGISSVLDVGYGEGTNTRALAVRFPNAAVKGIDFSIETIRLARQDNLPSNLSFEHDLDTSALDGQYDLVCFFEVLEHVEDWQAFSRCLSNVSRRYLLLSVPTGRRRSFEKNVGHLPNFQHGQLEKILKELGLIPVVVLYAGWPWYSPIYRNICNMTNSGSNSSSTGEYGWRQKVVAYMLFFLFRRLSCQQRWGSVRWFILPCL